MDDGQPSDRRLRAALRLPGRGAGQSDGADRLILATPVNSGRCAVAGSGRAGPSPVRDALSDDCLNVCTRGKTLRIRPEFASSTDMVWRFRFAAKNG